MDAPSMWLIREETSFQIPSAVLLTLRSHGSLLWDIGSQTAISVPATSVSPEFVRNAVLRPHPISPSLKLQGWGKSLPVSSLPSDSDTCCSLGANSL